MFFEVEVMKNSRKIMFLQEHNSFYLRQTDTKNVARFSMFNNINVNIFYDNIVELLIACSLGRSKSVTWRKRCKYRPNT